MPYTYILECSDGSYYTGSTWSLDGRVAEHSAGLGCGYTKERLPVKLVYWEAHDRIEDAFAREKQIQRWSRAKKTALIEGHREELKKRAKRRLQ